MKIVKNKPYFSILILQFAAVISVIIFVFIAKFIGGEFFENFKQLYTRYFEDETVIIDEAVINDSSAQTVVSKNYVKFDNSNGNLLILPLSGTVTSDFGVRQDPFDNTNKKHYGIDIAANYGTEIFAACNGQVEKVGFDENGYGNYVILKHNDKLKTLYGHCSEITVNEGSTVNKGSVVAKVGSTGKSTGNHLHFEIIVNGVKVNPEWYLNFR